MRALTTSALVFLAACGGAGGGKLAAYEANDKTVADHMAVFDDLDFNVFTNQKWDDLHKSHAADIIVHWPDGHTTTGIDKHIEDLKAMFVYAPDTNIKVHPIKIGNGEWTAVEGVMEGTFTQPMPLPDGKSIPPTGKAFKLAMVTVGHWNQDGVMSEEYLFWDNLTFMRQIGLMP
jgi:hypothetical protein